MKPGFARFASVSMLFFLLAVTIPAHAYADSLLRISLQRSDGRAALQQVTDTSTATIAPTDTSAPQPILRPQIAVQNYRTKPENVQNGQNFALIVKLRNEGEAQAFNVQATFTSSDFVPLKNGGVNIVGDLIAGNSLDIDQPMTVANYVYGIVSVAMNLSYSDATGAVYSEQFALNIRVSGGGGSYVTSTPTGVKSSQLVITSYAASLDPLQPGEQFNLAMTVQNTGNAKAQRVTMIVGGGSSGTSSGTAAPGGVSGGSGEFTNFAPVGASNVQTLGDLGAGDAIQAKQDLIVNVSTNPGAYPVKVTFSYLNDKGEVVNDDQVITLLVYSLPTVDISFYRPPDPFYVGQPGALPIQVVNLGKRLSVLGTLKITSASGTIENGTSLVGSLDAGGYFTLDSMITPEQSGKMDLDVTIEYTDDFNQPRTINRKLQIEVMEGIAEPTPDPTLGGGGGGEAGPIPTNETTLQKVWRFVLGLFGLDSAPPSTNPGVQPGPGIEEPVVPVKPGTGKG